MSAAWAREGDVDSENEGADRAATGANVEGADVLGIDIETGDVGTLDWVMDAGS